MFSNDADFQTDSTVVAFSNLEMSYSKMTSHTNKV